MRAGLLCAAVAVLAAGPVAALAPPQEVFTNTLYVEDMVADGETLWVASRGGIEAYALRTLARRRLYTTRDGLLETAQRQVLLTPASGAGAAQVQVRGERSLCTLRRAEDRFVCSAAAPLASPAPVMAQSLRGARVTGRLPVGARVFVGTAGRGLWLDGATPRALSPTGQICSNHVMALAEHQGRLWLGSFDEGLCSYDPATRRFTTADTPFRMVNALQSTGAGLYIASSEGLFLTRDGQRFDRVPFVRERGINHLASDGASLYATSPAALYQLALPDGSTGRRDRVLWRPGGSRALQAVALGQGALWLASEDLGAIRVPLTPRGALPPSGGQVYDRAAGLPSSWALAVAAAPQGGAYVATLRHGLLHVDAAGQSREVPGLPDRWLLHVSDARDPSAAASAPLAAGLWVGTQGGAAFVSPRGEVSAIPALPHPCAHALLARAGAVWVATEGGTSVHAL